ATREGMGPMQAGIGRFDDRDQLSQAVSRRRAGAGGQRRVKDTAWPFAEPDPIDFRIAEWGWGEDAQLDRVVRWPGIARIVGPRDVAVAGAAFADGGEEDLRVRWILKDRRDFLVGARAERLKVGAQGPAGAAVGRVEQACSGSRQDVLGVELVD